MVAIIGESETLIFDLPLKKTMHVPAWETFLFSRRQKKKKMCANLE